MKRITLNIDLEENEAFEKEIEEIIKAKVREQVRNNNVKLIEDVTSKEIERLTEGKQWSYLTKLESIVKNNVENIVRRDIRSFDLNKIVEEKMNEKVDMVLYSIENDIRQKCISTINKIVTEEVSELLKSILQKDINGDNAHENNRS